MPTGEASREELNSLGDSLREALAADRSERVEHLTRIETKFDTRMDAFYSILADYKEKTGDQAARLAVLEKAMADLLAANANRFEAVQRETGQRIADLIASSDKRLTDIRSAYDERIGKIERKQERNWNWMMALVGAVVMLIVTSAWASYSKSPARQPEHVHDAKGNPVPIPTVN